MPGKGGDWGRLRKRSSEYGTALFEGVPRFSFRSWCASIEELAVEPLEERGQARCGGFGFEKSMKLQFLRGREEVSSDGDCGLDGVDQHGSEGLGQRAWRGDESSALFQAS
ncbi:hypothetical protein ATY41_08680 [Leifsonia xyli subsp. xyli]|uniref:Uncharacterized protein n=1 Tax=Leifsonia xyli subsp. xyli TaxID=59736 RepID=A0A1E2SLI5_LEIXY|nr:hypothetical protein ATY41_08680 [Leifsonia xyli subsp. xyli]